MIAIFSHCKNEEPFSWKVESEPRRANSLNGIMFFAKSNRKRAKGGDNRVLFHKIGSPREPHWGSHENRNFTLRFSQRTATDASSLGEPQFMLIKTYFMEHPIFFVKLRFSWEPQWGSLGEPILWNSTLGTYKIIIRSFQTIFPL